MATYANETEAAADGFRVIHEPERHRFALYGPEKQLFGEAHYSLFSDDVIDFDHTLVVPELRGTGLSGILAQRALTDDIIGERKITASCSYIQVYLRRHPELLAR
ncbi:N-acetyltransferase [Leucobacter coleopterorum]|uniref:N-acetyltransferase n=1 Tax=Leucobacter coleopterorum TaxID=2714933 RepID=A0ABX6JWR2_9MICO|nr:GNAT family N-acetyltransferase [Leucobacter coleopterorum]QIM18744.1 N-acetyltransferase [Leucobacter coleopterorum]